MRKGTKAFLIILFVLATAAILVFILSRCAEPDSPAVPSPTPSAPAPAEESPITMPTPSASASISPVIPSTAPDDSQPSREENSTLNVVVDGKALTEAAKLISADFGTGIRGYGYNLYCLTDSFDYTEKDGADRYFSTQSDNCWLELRFVAGKTVDSSLPSFLDGYLNYTSIDYIGDYMLAGSLYTQSAQASDGTLTFEAYLADADGGMLTFVLCYPNSDAAMQAPRLHAMLDSFQFNY